MKRSLILLNSLLMGLVFAVYGSSFAFDFPITYTGTYHLKQEFTNQYGTGICEGDGALTIILSADGNLTYKADVLLISTHDSTGQPRSCEIIPKGYNETLSGTYKDDGSFSVPSGSSIVPPITGNYDEKHITAKRLWSWTGGQQTMDFDLPATNQPPKITLEPAAYPEFQMNILEGKGFTVKIRKEDGVMDSQGNWKIDWSSIRFKTNGVDNSTHFIDTAEKLWIFSVTDDKKEVRIKITPNPEKVISEQNVFNIQWNGEHKIELYICDTEGHCGKSEYSMYFGPFALLGEIKDLRCTGGEEILDIGSIVVGNVAYASPATYVYMALINDDKPDEYWCARLINSDDFGNTALVWFEGEVQPLMNLNLPGTFSWISTHLPLSLYRSFSLNKELKPFPAGNYKFLAFARDISTEALNGDIKEAKTCSK
jgi:hypothetical protein